MNSGLFDEEFALADAANAATQARQKQTQRSAAIARKASALVLRRATSEAELARLLPPILAKEPPTTSCHLAIESSANVNTNPRFEQTAIHTSRPLLEFYEKFFAQVQCIDKRQRLAKP